MIQSRLQSLQEMEVISSQGVEFCELMHKKKLISGRCKKIKLPPRKAYLQRLYSTVVSTSPVARMIIIQMDDTLNITSMKKYVPY